MSYWKPTFGGLKELQDFLDGTPYRMPVFMRCSVGENGIKNKQIQKEIINLDELILEHGAFYEALDCRLESEDGEIYLQFNDVAHYSEDLTIIFRMIGYGCVIQYPEDKQDFLRFIDDNREAILNLARLVKK